MQTLNHENQRCTLKGGADWIIQYFDYLIYAPKLRDKVRGTQPLWPALYLYIRFVFCVNLHNQIEFVTLICRYSSLVIIDALPLIPSIPKNSELFFIIDCYFLHALIALMMFRMGSMVNLVSL